MPNKIATMHEFWSTKLHNCPLLAVRAKPLPSVHHWSSFPQQGVATMTVELAGLTAADFEARIEEDFRIPTEEGAIALKLVEVRRLGRALREGGAFSLSFLSPPGPILPQAIYPLDNAALGTVELFLVALGPKDGGNSYEAVFT
jgi:hypothetical protein